MKARMCASLLAVCLLLGTLAGCGHKESVIATQGGVEIPIGYYTIQQMLMRVRLENYHGDGYEDYMAAPNESDPTKSNAQVLNEEYRNAFELLWLFKLKVEELGLEMDEIRQSYFEQEYEYFKGIFNSTADYRLFLKEANLTEEEHKEIYKINTFYPDLLYAHFYDPEVGVERIDEAALRDYFDSLVDYSIQHILFAYGDDKAAAKQEAEQVLSDIQSGTIKFDKAMAEHSDDSGLATYPHGYGFVENEEGFPAVFTTAAKELAVNDYAIYQSDVGYHIIKRISNDKYFEDMLPIYRQAYGSEQMQEKYQQWLSQLDFDYNEAALEAYDFTASGRTNVNLRKQRG